MLFAFSGKEKALLTMPRVVQPQIEPHEVMQIYRKRLGYTQSYIAMRLFTSQIYVSRIERGLIKPNEREIGVIEQLLGVRIWSKEE